MSDSKNQKILLQNNATAWEPCLILSDSIGSGTNIGALSHIGSSVIIGKDCKIQGSVYIADGCTIGDEVFIGPNATLTNDRYPPSGGKWKPVIVQNKVVIGASAGVFGCMIAYTNLFPKARLSLPFLSSFSISARLLVLLYILNEIYFIVYNPIENVAHFAHLGGALGGLLVSFIWKRTITKKIEERNNQKLTRNNA